MPSRSLERYRNLAAPAGVALAVAAALTLVLVPLVQREPLIGFTADDADITFRYSLNFAAGHGPLWNLTGPRTDGYTSPLWMALIALVHLLGVAPAPAAKLLALLSALGIALLLAYAGGARAAMARVVAIAAIALSPAYMALTVQGMETTIAGCLAAVTAWLLVRATRKPGHRELAALGAVAALAVLARPDLAVFVAICFLGLGTWLLRSRQRAALLRAVLWVACACVLPLAAWAAWRWAYYGYPLPNTAYVKRAGALVDPLSWFYVRTFATEFAPPYMLLLVVLGVRAYLRRGTTDSDKARTWAVASALLGALAFLAATLKFLPIQGDLWRFQMPVFPVLLLCGVLLASSDPLVARLGRGGPAWRRAAVALAVLGLVLFPLATIGETRVQVGGRWTYDREQVGKALARYRDDGLSMFITESGAIPLYSGWHATDQLGLNDHYIAVHGATPQYVDSLDPDLLQFVVDLPRTGFEEFNRLLRSGRFQFALATVKTNSKLIDGAPPQAHFYFVRAHAPHLQEVLATLRAVPGVKRLPTAMTQGILRAFGYRAPRPTAP